MGACGRVWGHMAEVVARCRACHRGRGMWYGVRPMAGVGHGFRVCDRVWEHVAGCGVMGQEVMACHKGYGHIAGGGVGTCGRGWGHVAGGHGMWQGVETYGRGWEHVPRARGTWQEEGWEHVTRLAICGRVWHHVAGVEASHKARGKWQGGYVKCQKVKDVDYE